MSSMLEVQDLEKRFPIAGGQFVHAVNGVSFRIQAGETLGVVGESGSGKSTVGRLALRLLKPSAGTVRFMGQDISQLPEKDCRKLRSQMQIVFQDPWAALNPRMTARDLIAEPLVLHVPLDAAERRRKVSLLAERVRLSETMLNRYPGELSGGQLQRICIARAISTDPKLIVLDEPTSSLDLSVRAGVLALLDEIKRDTGVAMLFISHDLGTLGLVCDRIAVMYLGRIVEEGPAQRVFDAPLHPYARALISAHLPADPAIALHRQVLTGEVPSPIRLPSGCAFASRCPVPLAMCREEVPLLRAMGAEPMRRAACVHSPS